MVTKSHIITIKKINVCKIWDQSYFGCHDPTGSSQGREECSECEYWSQPLGQVLFNRFHEDITDFINISLFQQIDNLYDSKLANKERNTIKDQLKFPPTTKKTYINFIVH